MKFRSCPGMDEALQTPERCLERKQRCETVGGWTGRGILAAGPAPEENLRRVEEGAVGSGELYARGGSCAVGRQRLLQLAQKEHCLRLSSWSWRAHSGSPRGPRGCGSSPQQ